MLSVFFTALVRVGLLVALALPGLVLQKLKKLPEQTIAVLSAFVIYISQPMLSLYSFMTAEFSSDLLPSMIACLIIAFVFNIGFFSLARVIFIKDKDESAGKICTMASSLSNCGFLGIPLIQLVFQNPVITIYAVIYMVAFNIVLWTLGVWIITGDKSYVSLKKAFLNLPTLVLVVGIPIFLCNLSLATSDNVVISAIMTFCKYFNDFNAPFTMIMMGIRLADIKFIELLNNKRLYIVSALKLVIFPLIALGIMMALRLIPNMPIDNFAVVSLLICVAMPTAAMTISFAETFGGDKFTAVKATLQTTVFSIITIPLFVTLLSLLGLVVL